MLSFKQPSSITPNTAHLFLRVGLLINIPWTCSVVYKQMQINSNFSLWSQTFITVDSLNLSAQTFCLLKHKETFPYKLHFRKKIHTETSVPLASFWKEAVL